MEEVERGRVVRVEMEDVASGLEWTQIGVYMPVRGQAKGDALINPPDLRQK